MGVGLMDVQMAMAGHNPTNISTVILWSYMPDVAMNILGDNKKKLQPENNCKW